MRITVILKITISGGMMVPFFSPGGNMSITVTTL
jgi:hypothetical protein